MIHYGEISVEFCVLHMAVWFPTREVANWPGWRPHRLETHNLETWKTVLLQLVSLAAIAANQFHEESC